MSRYFNYLENFSEFGPGFVIVKKIIEDILSLDNDYLSQDDIIELDNYKKELIRIDNSLGFDSYNLERVIRDDLLLPINVNYFYEHHKYPDNPSELGNKINKLFMRVFEIEDQIQFLVAKKWHNILTPFEHIENGKPFIVIGHSGFGFISLPGDVGYKNNSYYNTDSISCSVFTDKDINCYNSNLVMLFDVNIDNYISSVPFDSVTSKISTDMKSVRAVKVTREGKSVIAGYTHNYDKNMVVTKVENPKKVIEKINSRSNNVINETILDKNTSTPLGLILFTDGYDFPLLDYIQARKMIETYGIKLKVINKSLYNLSTTNNIQTVEEKIKTVFDLLFKMNYTDEELTEILEGFIDDVIKSSKLEPELQSAYIDCIEDFKPIKKKVY